ncbi:MAG: alpha/beta fold hydrolase [Chloroflexi bacterium]|nr:alpha/beta fold hydrolase [Chloroflexota bacterium]
MAPDYEVFELGDYRLQSGVVLPDARLAYQTYGELNAVRDNVVVYPTAYGGTHANCEPIIGAGLALDPSRYFIVVPNMFGNGLSSSPSNTPAPFSGPDFPGVTIHDMVQAQHRLLSERFGIERIRLVTGTSMGGLQAFEWGAAFPELVERIVPRCGAARCSPHNWVFLDGIEAALTADAAFAGGRYQEPPTNGLRAMGRVWAGWALSQAFYREERWRELGAESLADYLATNWGARPLDANDQLAMIWSWQHADISANAMYRGDFDQALAAIRARAIVMPSSTDLYFPPEDNAYEVARMPIAELRPFETVWGHLAGSPGPDPQDAAALDLALREILAA